MYISLRISRFQISIKIPVNWQVPGAPEFGNVDSIPPVMIKVPAKFKLPLIQHKYNKIKIMKAVVFYL